MSADTLTTTSRSFYERAKFKVGASIIISGAGLMLLGFTSSAGGESASSSNSANADDVDSNSKDSYNALASGYGFAAFCYILAFILFIAASIYVSPLFCGSPNEKKMLNSPQELDSSGYAAYSENSSPNASSKV